MLVIKKAKREDACLIYEVIKACADDMYNRYGLEHWIPYYSLESIEKNIEEKDVFVLIEEKEIIGTFTLSNLNNVLWKEQDAKKAVYLSKLAIKPQKEGKGHGKLCMEFIEEYAKNNNFDAIRFDVYEKSKSAVGFYEKRGYKKVDIANTRRFKVLLMEKVLERENKDEEDNDNRCRNATSVCN